MNKVFYCPKKENHNSDAQYDFPAEDNIFRILIPRKEIQDNNGINETDNNTMPNI